MSRCSVIQLTAAVAVVTAMTAMLATAQQAPARGGSAGMIELGPDDKPAFPDPPAGFNLKRDNVAHGELTAVQYDSKSLGTRRQIRVYTPPGYSTHRKYPVLYLLHGLGWNDLEWTQMRHADVVIDNLLADGMIPPMLMVFRNGDANTTAAAIAAAGGAWIGRAGGVGGVAPNYDSWGMPFENDLLKDIIPYVAAHYSVYNDREHRALAGLSMGGGQTLNIGLAHVETFAWIGGFSSAPITKAPADLVPDPARLKRLKVLWLACGNKDGLIRVGGRSQVPQGERRPSRLAC